jgi:hypothetical protein
MRTSSPWRELVDYAHRARSIPYYGSVSPRTADDDRLPPLACLKNSISSVDEGYHANSRLSLTKDAKQEVTTTKKSSSEHKRVSSKPTTDDDDNNCLPLGASHNFLDSSIANNPQDELFEQLYEMDLNDYEMDLNDNDDFNGAHRSWNGNGAWRQNKSVVAPAVVGPEVP